MEGFNFLLKKQNHPLIILAVAMSLILLSFLFVNHYDNYISSLYNGIKETAEKQPLWPKAKTVAAHSEPTTKAATETAGNVLGESTTVEKYQPVPKPESSSKPATQTTSTSTNPPAQQPESEPDPQPAPLICVLGVCI